MRLTRRDLFRTSGLAVGSALLLPGLAGRAAAAGLPSLRPGGPARVGPFLALAGSLHDHTTDSDGDSADDVVSSWLVAHRQELGIDYASFTDHSDGFPVAVNRTPPDPSSLWQRQAVLTAQRSGPDFAYLRGFEWTNDQQNHLNVLLSSGWTSRAVTGDAALTMAAFWQWFTLPPAANDPSGALPGGGDGIGQFNHPGDKGALNWDDYALDSGAAARMCTIEVHGDQGGAVGADPATPAGTGSPLPRAGTWDRS